MRICIHEIREHADLYSQFPFILAENLSRYSDRANMFHEISKTGCEVKGERNARTQYGVRIRPFCGSAAINLSCFVIRLPKRTFLQ